MSSIGSPKKTSPPCSSSVSRPRWMAPIEAVETLPYSVVKVLGVLADVLDHGAQILEVEQQQALVVGDLEHQLQHAGLGVVEVEQAGEQQRPHVGNRRAHRMALLAENVPESTGLAGHEALMPSVQPLLQLGADSTPAAPGPERSPFTSAMNTGTPA
jgi:hypothetical protein